MLGDNKLKLIIKNTKLIGELSAGCIKKRKVHIHTKSFFMAEYLHKSQLYQY